MTEEQLRENTIAIICTLWGKNFDEMLSSQRLPINICTDKLMSLFTDQLELAKIDGELVGAKRVDNIVRNSPDPRADAQKYISELGGGDEDE